MFSTVENEERMHLDVENMWQTGIFAWKTISKDVENVWAMENASKS